MVWGVVISCPYQGTVFSPVSKSTKACRSARANKGASFWFKMACNFRRIKSVYAGLWVLGYGDFLRHKISSGSRPAILYRSSPFSRP